MKRTDNMIYIRADANPQIGFGHIMRCLSIADAMKRTEYEIIFILADETARCTIENRGYKTVILESDYKRMADELSRWPQKKAEIIIVDSYSVTYDYLEALKRRTNKLVYIDDLALFAYPVDVVINYNAYSFECDYRKLYNNNPPQLILGTMYVPLRNEFMGLPFKVQKKKVTDVLISTGGADPFHLALSIVRKRPRGVNYHILVGTLNADKAEIIKAAADNDRIIIHENVMNMGRLISQSDIVVSAAGTTIYEICACGVPLITYILADNQILGAETFGKLGIAVNIGDIRNKGANEERILNAIKALCTDYDKRCLLANRMRSIVDGFGAHRIIDMICGR